MHALGHHAYISGKALVAVLYMLHFQHSIVIVDLYFVVVVVMIFLCSSDSDCGLNAIILQSYIKDL